LHLLEDLDRDDVEARPSIDVSAVDSDVVNSGRAQEGIVPTTLVEIGWSSLLKPILLEDHFSLGLFMLGCAAVISRDSCLKWRFDSGA
jgi:hypothetical protein